MKTLELFNSVLVNDKSVTTTDLKLDETVKYGFILHPSVAALKNVDEVINYLDKKHLSGEQLNSSFHKSWEKIASSSREELLAHQLMHYFSTYGLESLGLYSDDYIYIPNEVLHIPELKVEKLPFKVIKAVTRDELIEKCLNLFSSGIALKQDTIMDIISILQELEYKFDSIDNIKNKEAKLIISDLYDIFPSDPVEFLRMLVYKATFETTLIKSPELINMIKNSNIEIADYCNKFGLEKLSTIFFRYKPIFLAFKNKANESNLRYALKAAKIKSSNGKYITNSQVINRLRKLANKNHKPMKSDFLNEITSMDTFDEKSLKSVLGKLNNFRKIRVLYALHQRLTATSDVRLYKIRNGKVWVDAKERSNNHESNMKYYDYILNDLASGLKLNGVKVKYPKNINYVLPATEKQFIGNIPSGTFIDVDNEDVILGIYWENSGGARDLDLSMMGLDKIGWNSDYKSSDNKVLFSGDVTSAPNGATELFYIKNSLNVPHLMVNNIFSGSIGAKFKIIVAKEQVKSLNKNYMVDPNNILLEIDSEMDQKQKVLGLIIPKEDKLSFVLTDFNLGNKSVSSTGGVTDQAKQFLVDFYNNPITLKEVLTKAGCVFVDEDADIDLSIENLEKDTIISLFNENKLEKLINKEVK